MKIKSEIVKLYKKILCAPYIRRVGMRFAPFDAKLHDQVLNSWDPVRYGAIALALKTLSDENISGAIAELGVFQGATSRVLHQHAPARILYLFDTFQGFPDQDLKTKDERFRNTNIDLVKSNLTDLNNVVFRAGYFPDTTLGLEAEQFAFVMLDADLYAPTLSGLQFFYPRLNKGAYLFLHDYNNPESEWGVKQAATEFFADKLENLIAIPDTYGSVLIRKM